MKTILEPARQIPVCWEGDICVLGGSCTGLFAAVRAARLGARVCVVEKQNCFGGMATAGLINIWHSLYDFDDQERVIAGLTLEVDVYKRHIMVSERPDSCPGRASMPRSRMFICPSTRSSASCATLSSSISSSGSAKKRTSPVSGSTS